MNRTDLEIGSIVSDRNGKVFSIEKFGENNKVFSHNGISEYINFLLPVDITGNMLISLGLNYDQRTGWFRWGKDLKKGIIRKSAGWVVREIVNENDFLDHSPIKFIYEFQKKYKNEYSNNS